MKWSCKILRNKKLDEAPEEPKLEQGSTKPDFDVRTIVTPGRYPRALIEKAEIWQSLANRKSMLRLQVCVNPYEYPEQYGHIYLTRLAAAELFDALYIDRTDRFESLVGKYIAVECFPINYDHIQGTKLEIAGPKIVWKDN